MSILIQDLEFKVLDAGHLRQLTSFRCKNAELKDFLTQDALKNQLDRISVTRLVFYHGRLVGYFTLVTDVIKRGEIAGIQRNFLPETIPKTEGFDVAAKSIPAKEVGGDFFDVMPLEVIPMSNAGHNPPIVLRKKW